MLTGYRKYCLLAVISLAVGLIVGVNACEDGGGNRPPKIVSGISAPRPIVVPGERIQLRVISATDPDGDTITYTWKANRGTVEPSGPSAASAATYTAPSELGDDKVTVTVSDGKGGTATDAIKFTVVVGGETPSPVATGTPTPTPAAVPSQSTAMPSQRTATPTVVPSVEITEPVDGGTVEYITNVRGTFANVPADRDIWVVVQPHLAPQFHPQPRAIIDRPKGEWWATAYFGASPSTNIGEKFDVIVVLADADGSQAFKDYLSQVEQTGSKKGLAFLPDGVESYDHITVTRG